MRFKTDEDYEDFIECLMDDDEDEIERAKEKLQYEPYEMLTGWDVGLPPPGTRMVFG